MSKLSEKSLYYAKKSKGKITKTVMLKDFETPGGEMSRDPCSVCSTRSKKVYHYDKCPSESRASSHGILGFNPILLDED